MPNFQLGDTEKASYALTALDGDSNPAVLASGDVVSVTSSDPTSLTVVADATPVAGSLASGFILGSTQLQNGVQVTASIKKADGSLELSTMSLVDVVGGQATSLTLGFGAPVLQGGTGGGTTPPPPGAPAVASLTPASGAIGSAVTIAGTGFGATQGASTISFGNTAAVTASKRAAKAKPAQAIAGGTDAGQATSYSDTSITINVPAGAVTGNVIVTTAAGASNGSMFTVDGGVNPPPPPPPGSPNIASFAPSTGAVGSTVVLTGTGFGALQGSTTLTVGAVAASASAWSDTSVTFAIPALPVGLADILVNVGGVNSNAQSFNVTAAAARR
jgi:hypothetical protein